MRIILYVFFPLWILEVLADSYNVFEEFLTEVFGNLFHEPCGNKVNFYVYVHGNIDKPDIFFDWSIPDNKIFIIQLNIFLVYIDRKFKHLLQIYLIVNRASKEKQFLTLMVKPTIAYALKERLSFGKKRQMVKSIPNSTVSGNFLFLSGNF